MQADVQAALTKARNEPTNFEAQLKAAELYYQIQRYDDSITYLLKANQLKPDDPETVGNLGMVNMDAGHFETAETWYKAALTKKPDDVRFLSGYCSVLLQLAKAKEAEEAMSKLAKIDPTSQDLTTFRERLATLKSGGKGK
jgi:tetratricopeptide (TPR) repeat protein